MATILEFPKRRGRQVCGSSIATDLNTADIVIFPGVRYEYWGRGHDTVSPSFPEPEPVRERERK
jgi:hypothetical protein